MTSWTSTHLSQLRMPKTRRALLRQSAATHRWCSCSPVAPREHPRACRFRCARSPRSTHTRSSASTSERTTCSGTPQTRAGRTGCTTRCSARLPPAREACCCTPGFSAPLTWQIIEKFGVTNFAAAPTVYRSLRADKAPVPEGISLRRASSAGEPLTPDVVAWSKNSLGVEVRDHYGQTEHGMFIVNAWADGLRDDVRPGSMGRPLPGWSAAVLEDNSDDIAPARTQGRVAIDTHNSPLMWFTGYVDAPEKTKQRFSEDGRWYITGDAGMTDEDGFFFFSSRDDDVIIMAGYRIGPFDVESVLVMHEHVIEAAVVGMPDELRGEVLEAFVVLREGVDGDDELEKELQTLVKKKFAAHAYPRTVHFVPNLPKTPSGKVQRYILRKG